MARTRTWMTAAVLGIGLALGAAGGASAQDADTPLDKALQSLEALIAKEKAKPSPDEALLRSLEAIGDNLRREKESKGGGKSPGGGGPSPALPAGQTVAEWALNIAKQTFTRGCELKEDEKSLADQIITEFATDYYLAKNNEDEKSKPLIREHTERRVGRSYGPRDANRMKDNLDEIIKGWERNYGRGGGGKGR